MSLRTLSDVQLSEFLSNPNEFLKDRENYSLIFDQEAEDLNRKIRDVSLSLGRDSNSFSTRIEDAK